MSITAPTEGINLRPTGGRQSMETLLSPAGEIPGPEAMRDGGHDEIGRIAVRAIHAGHNQQPPHVAVFIAVACEVPEARCRGDVLRAEREGPAQPHKVPQGGEDLRLHREGVYRQEPA